MDSEYLKKLQDSCAFTPCYTAGNFQKMTKIYLKGGNVEYLPYSINKVINDYCAINFKCIKSIKLMCGRITCRRSLFPLYIKKDIILLPIKTLKPCIRGDKCIGYLNSNFIEDIDYEKSIIKMRNGCELVYLERNDTIKTRIADCALLNKRILSI